MITPNPLALDWDIRGQVTFWVMGAGVSVLGAITGISAGMKLVQGMSGVIGSLIACILASSAIALIEEKLAEIILTYGLQPLCSWRWSARGHWRQGSGLRFLTKY